MTDPANARTVQLDAIKLRVEIGLFRQALEDLITDGGCPIALAGDYEGREIRMETIRHSGIEYLIGLAENIKTEKPRTQPVRRRRAKEAS